MSDDRPRLELNTATGAYSIVVPNPEAEEERFGIDITSIVDLIALASSAGNALREVERLRLESDGFKMDAMNFHKQLVDSLMELKELQESKSGELVGCDINWPDCNHVAKPVCGQCHAELKDRYDELAGIHGTTEQKLDLVIREAEQRLGSSSPLYRKLKATLEKMK